MSQKERAALKPCPFCGGPASIETHGGVAIYCPKCDIDMPNAESWNRRYPDETPEQEDPPMVCKNCGASFTTHSFDCPNCHEPYPDDETHAPAGDDPLWKAGDVDLDAISKSAPAGPMCNCVPDWPLAGHAPTCPLFAPPEAARRLTCTNCGAEVSELHETTIGQKVCCIHCVFNPLGCRCRYGEFGVAETEPVVEDPSAGGGK